MTENSNGIWLEGKTKRRWQEAGRGPASCLQGGKPILNGNHNVRDSIHRKREGCGGRKWAELSLRATARVMDGSPILRGIEET